jgi:peptidoglycan/xylan/chitin deacetylase (PgdA/CDA1 family)
MGYTITFGTAALVALLLLQSGTPIAQAGDRRIIIRVDDIQDFNYSNHQQRVLRFHLENKIPIILGVIPTRFGFDEQLIQLITRGSREGLFKIAIHGWKHESMRGLSLSEQIRHLRQGKNTLENLGLETRVLIPPLNEFDNNTLQAMKENDLTVISSATYYGDEPGIREGIMHIPSTVTTAEVDFETDSWVSLSLEDIKLQTGESWNSYGVAVVLLHPRQFLSIDGSWGESKWESYLMFLDWLKDTQADFSTIDAPPSPIVLNWNSLTISVALFVSISSTILVALHIDHKRKKQMVHHPAAAPEQSCDS